MKKWQRLGPVLILFFLAPAIGELLSGSSPPVEFLNPFVLLIEAALYGSGAILIRELRVRWGKGWPSVLILGAAYGIVEEGWMVKSFFDPGWVDLGVLGSYGRTAGVNWIWSLELTLYHAVFSIAIPILLVELLFPARRDERWLGRRGMIGLAILLMADVAAGFLWLTPYRPPLGPYLLAIVAVGMLVALARVWPARSPARPQPEPVPRPLRFAAAGLLATLAFFVSVWVLPSLGVPVGLVALAIVAVAGTTVWAASRLSRGGAWTDEHIVALAGGALGFFVLLAPLQELDAARADNPAGMAGVGLLTVLLLLALWGRVRGQVPAKSAP